MNTNTLKVISKHQSRYTSLMGAIDLLVNNGWRPGRAARHVLIKNGVIKVAEMRNVVVNAIYDKMVKDVCEHWEHTRFNGHFYMTSTNETVVRRAYEEVVSCVSSDAHLMHPAYIVPDVGMFLNIVTNERGDIISRAWARVCGDDIYFYSTYGYERRMESILLAIGAKYTREWANGVIDKLKCVDVVIDPVTLKSTIVDYTPIVDGATIEALYADQCM